MNIKQLNQGFWKIFCSFQCKRMYAGNIGARLFFSFNIWICRHSSCVSRICKRKILTRNLECDLYTPPKNCTSIPVSFTANFRVKVFRTAKIVWLRVIHYSDVQFLCLIANVRENFIVLSHQLNWSLIRSTGTLVRTLAWSMQCKLVTRLLRELKRVTFELLNDR